eukprot:3980231-Alexandrium_andersonii.AAC.1
MCIRDSNTHAEGGAAGGTRTRRGQALPEGRQAHAQRDNPQTHCGPARRWDSPQQGRPPRAGRT